jgi:CIC family chloride channel protein
MPVIARVLVLALFAGLVTGVAVSFYVLATELLRDFLFAGNPYETATTLPVWYLYAMPTLAILLVNYLSSKHPSVREYGVAEIADTVTGNKSFITLKGLFLKIIASTLSLASGFSVGNEGPSAAIGAMIAYKLNHLFSIPERFVRLVLSIGASAGIAAVFVSPITGIVFSIENIAYRFVKRVVGPIILSAAIAYAIASQLLDPILFRYSIEHVFRFDNFLSRLLFIPVVLVFLYLYLLLRNRIFIVVDRLVSSHLGRYRNLFFAILGGLSIGTVLTIAPFAVFSGHEVVTSLINETFTIPVYFIVVIVLLRILTTTLSIYANAVGGLFLPLMSIGALVGYGYAEVINSLGMSAEPYSFAAIGAAVFMGVIMHLPLTAIVLALEITYDYNIVVPTAVIVVVTSYISNLRFDIEKLKATDIRSIAGKKKWRSIA